MDEEFFDKARRRYVRQFVGKFGEIYRAIAQFCRDRGLIVYGGAAINALLREKTDGAVTIYDPALDLPDFDLLSTDFLTDSRDLAAIIADLGYNYVRIVTGMVPKTRKIFAELHHTAFADINKVTKEEFAAINPVKINGIYFASPDFSKIDQYSNLFMNLFADIHRIKKAHSRLILLEKYYPTGPTGPTVPASTGPSAGKMLKKYGQEPDNDVIFGGDFAEFFHMTGKINLDLPADVYFPFDPMTLSQKGSDGERIISYRGECLYYTPVGAQEAETMRIASPEHLIRNYYWLKFRGVPGDWTAKIGKMLKKMGIFPSESRTDVKVHIPISRKHRIFKENPELAKMPTREKTQFLPLRA